MRQEKADGRLVHRLQGAELQLDTLSGRLLRAMQPGLGAQVALICGTVGALAAGVGAAIFGATAPLALAAAGVAAAGAVPPAAAGPSDAWRCSLCTACWTPPTAWPPAT